MYVYICIYMCVCVCACVYVCMCVCNKTHMKSNKCRAFNVSLKWCILTLKKAMLLTGGHEVVSIKILSFAKRCIRYSLPNLTV